MKHWAFTMALILWVILAGCTPRIYGVPQKQWDTMSEQERIAAMEAYKEHQETLRQQQAERARLQEMEKRAQLKREAEEAHRRQQRIDAIYSGKGQYGDLLRVHLEGGKAKIFGSRRTYHAVAFKIAAGEIKNVQIVDRKERKVSMLAYYDGSNLILDEASSTNDSGAARLPYEDDWQSGKTYAPLSTGGPLQFSNVSVTVKIVGQPPHNHGHRPGQGDVKPPSGHNPDVIIIGKPPQIEVAFRKGKLKIKNSSCPLAAERSVLKEGQVRTVNLRCKRSKIKVQLSYIDGELLIDDAPGRGKHINITRLPFAPGWYKGQSYIIPNTGNHNLADLELFITSPQQPRR